MLSHAQVAEIYLVQVRYPDGTVEQVEQMEYPALPAALEAASRLSAWLTYGHGCYLPEGAIDLRDDLVRAGVEPSAVGVEVAYPAEGAPHGYAVACAARAYQADGAEDELPDTVVEVLAVVGG